MFRYMLSNETFCEDGNVLYMPNAVAIEQLKSEYVNFKFHLILIYLDTKRHSWLLDTIGMVEVCMQRSSTPMDCGSWGEAKKD